MIIIIHILLHVFIKITGEEKKRKSTQIKYNNRSINVFFCFFFENSYVIGTGWKNKKFDTFLTFSPVIHINVTYVNVESNIEQVLAATPHKTPTIRPLASHHENYTS